MRSARRGRVDDEIAERYLDWLRVRLAGRRAITTISWTRVPETADVLEVAAPGCRRHGRCSMPGTASPQSTYPRASSRLARRNVPEARLVKADMAELDLPAGSFDAVGARATR